MGMFKSEWGKVIIAGSLLAVALAAGMSPLFRGNIVYEDDVAHYYIPAFKWYSDSIRADEGVSLTPEIFSGFPLALSQVGGFYDPINWLLFGFLPFPDSYHARIFINYLLGGIFTFLFARSLKLGFLASLVAMFAFTTAQYIIPGANILRSNSFFLMPALFYAIHELYVCAETNRRLRAVAYVLFGAVIIIESFLGGYTQLNIYGLIAAGLFALYLLYREFSFRFLVYVGALFGAGIAVLLPYIAAALELASASARAGGLQWQSASQSISAGAYFQNLTFDLITPPWHGSTLQSLYAGLVGVFFFFCSLFFVRRHPTALFFAGLLVFSVVSAFPYPLFYLMQHLPVFEYFRYPPHWFFVSSFALSILAGIGLEQVRASAASRFAAVQKWLQVQSVRVAIVAICVVNLALPMYLSIARQSVSADALFEEPWIVRTIRERSGSDQFRTVQPYPGVLSWFLFVKDYYPTAAQKIDFNSEYTQTHLTPLLWGMDSVRGFDNLVPRRYAQVLAYIDQKQSSNVFEQGYLVLPESIMSLLGMMNVKYMWSIPSVEAQHERDVELLEIGKVNFDDITFPFHLYENKRYLPRWYVPPSVTILQEGESNFATIIEAENDFSKRAFIECSSCEKGELSQLSATVELIASGNNYLTFRSESPEEFWLVVSNANIPGWRAYIDEEETGMYYANYIYQGVSVPAGSHKVHLEYPSPYATFLPDP